MSILLFVHICTAVIALMAGTLSMMLRKGSGWHGAAGTTFFVSMLAMTSSAAYVAAFERVNRLNLEVSLLTFYLVATAWVAAKRRDPRPSLFDRVAMLGAFAVGIAGFTWGFRAAGNTPARLDGMPPAIFFVFATIALLHAVSDVRMIWSGGVSGGRRLARHLWRMCFAFAIALLSFYPGQARLFPKELRDTNLLMLPHLLLVAFIIISLVRNRRSYARRKAQPEVAILKAAA